MSKLHKDLLKQDGYLFENNLFVIEDQELNIHIKENLQIRTVSKDSAPLPGLVREHRDEGSLYKIYFKIEGELEGECVTYDVNEAIEAQCYYQKGKLHGPSRFFSREGICLSESWYYQDKKEGKQWRWFSCGQIACIQRYKNGLLHGKQEFYQENGQMRSQLTYDQGELEGYVLLFWPNGLKKRKTFFCKGKRVGLDQFWDGQGQLIYTKDYHTSD